MQYEEYRQLRAYSRYDSVYLAVLWLASFACTILSNVGSAIAAAGNLLLLATPFFVAYRLKKFRNEGLGGYISFNRALLYSIRVFFGGALLFAIMQWAYMRFLDGGRLLHIYQKMLSMPEMQPIIKAYGISRDDINVAIQQMFDPVFLASYSFIIAIFFGLFLSIILAAIMQKKAKDSNQVNQNSNPSNQNNI